MRPHTMATGMVDPGEQAPRVVLASLSNVVASISRAHFRRTPSGSGLNP